MVSEIDTFFDQIKPFLTEREYYVFAHRCCPDEGFKSWRRVKTLVEIGKELQLSKERIRQIEARACWKIRHRSSSRKTNSHLSSSTKKAVKALIVVKNEYWEKRRQTTLKAAEEAIKKRKIYEQESIEHKKRSITFGDQGVFDGFGNPLDLRESEILERIMA